jgi:hypothetical protein
MGKTLVDFLHIFPNSIPSRNVFVAIVNEYLAQIRDLLALFGGRKLATYIPLFNLSSPRDLGTPPNQTKSILVIVGCTYTSTS